MKRSTLIRWFTTATLAMATVLGTVPTADANGTVVGGYAGVRVWIDGGDVFPTYGDVTINVRADRDCYTTLFLVDTDGYLHVLYPTRPDEIEWIRGGRTYCYRAHDLGLDRLGGAGVAHVFAVGSPDPFDYSGYGASVFVGGFGFRIYGDPYVACRNFYVSLLPAQCRWDYVDVSCARFYVRHWVRYPSYLCYAGPGVHVRIGDTCRSCADLYASYRCSVSDPYAVVRPAARFKATYSRRNAVAAAPTQTGRVERVAEKTRSYKSVATAGRATVAAPVVQHGTLKRGASAFAKANERSRVVSTSRVKRDGYNGPTTTVRSNPAPRANAPAGKVKGNRATEPSQREKAGAQKKGATKKVRQAK